MEGCTSTRWKGIMKAYPFEEKRLLKWTPPYIIQPKLDGVRCRTHHATDGRMFLVSSEENIIHSVPHISDALAEMNLPFDLDGELYRHGMSFERIYSITSRTTNLHFEHREVEYHIFDIIPKDKVMNQAERLIALKGLPLQYPFIKVEFSIAMNLSEVIDIYNRYISSGYEGIIVRHFEAPYEEKRSVWMMKFKPKKEDIYEVVGAIEEISKDGIPKGTLGALVCKSGDGQVFNVGTGFTEDQRKQLWSIRGLLPGMKVRIKYQHTTAGRAVPRFPVFANIEP